MLKLENYSVAYGESSVIKALNLEIKDNEIVALLGRNGMEKTLTKSLIGMIKSCEGKAFLGKEEIENLKSYDRGKSRYWFCSSR